MDAQRLLGRVACRAAATTTTTAATATAATAARCSNPRALAFRTHTSAAAAAPSARRSIWTGPAAATRVFAPAASCVSTTTSPASPSLLSVFVAHRPSDRRYQSTANRTKRARNIAPHPSFLPASAGGVVGGTKKKAASKLGGDSPATALGVIPSATTTATTSGSGSSPATLLLYNPPASAPSVYQTPFKFLPKTDPRRRTNLTALFQQAAATATATASAASPSSSSSSPAGSDAALAPVLPHRSYDAPPQKYHLSEEDVAELRRLRALDPLEWSVLRLARHFQCSPIFVMLAVRSSAEHRQQRQEALAAVRQRWGPIRTKARDDRRKRQEMLYNGEL